MASDDKLIRAHEISKNNRELLLQDQLCGCFYCQRIFRSGEVVDWYGDHDETAVCPYCGIDAVIVERPDLPVTKAFLREMRQYLFTEAE